MKKKKIVNLNVFPQFYIFFVSCVKRKLVLWYKDRLTVQFVCTEYKVQGSVMTLKVWNLVPGEIVECRKKYQQLFYITFRSAVWYLMLHSDCPCLWKCCAFKNDSTANYLEEEQREWEREWVWIKEGVRERHSIPTYIKQKHKTSRLQRNLDAALSSSW